MSWRGMAECQENSAECDILTSGTNDLFSAKDCDFKFGRIACRITEWLSGVFMRFLGVFCKFLAISALWNLKNENDIFGL